ncbi:hypothetical protein [Streptomyces alkaliterrae]|uniref:hypothetical protein n=1 Tax=Streptomyces alkaliterrae TaxID=2213162 RepID=UPI002B20B4C4|nr:hypothetical protein [Streptomyces alkaliterrae]
MRPPPTALTPGRPGRPPRPGPGPGEHPAPTRRVLLRGAGAALTAVLPPAGCVPLVGCVPLAARSPLTGLDHAVAHLLDRQGAAVLSGDRAGYLDTVDTTDPADAAHHRRVFANLRRLPLAEWSHRVLTVRRTGARRAEAVAELRHRLRGYDHGPRTSLERLPLTWDDGRWRLAAKAPGIPRQLWEQGQMRLTRGRHSLVLTVGRPADERAALAREADLAVPRVAAAWPGPWTRRVVVLGPASLPNAAELLDGSPARYLGIAAVTSSEPRAAGPADRVVVNPEAYGTLDATGRQTVMTHETAHVATRAATTEHTPTWLSEGLADWIAHRGRTPDIRHAAPHLRAAALAGRLPERLPTDADFAFDGDPALLARAYEAGWLACRWTAERWGEARLARFYRAAGRPGPGALDRAARDVLGVDEREFTAHWRRWTARRLAD